MVTELDLELRGIITRAKSGDVGAFGELYTRYANLILRYLYARLREQESAQDLTQEVFVRVIKGIGGFEFRGEKSFNVNAFYGDELLGGVTLIVTKGA